MLRFYGGSKFQFPSQPLCKFMAPSYKINGFLLKVEHFLSEKLHPQRKVVSNLWVSRKDSFLVWIFQHKQARPHQAKGNFWMFDDMSFSIVASYWYCGIFWLKFELETSFFVTWLLLCLFVGRFLPACSYKCELENPQQVATATAQLWKPCSTTNPKPVHFE